MYDNQLTLPHFNKLQAVLPMPDSGVANRCVVQ